MTKNARKIGTQSAGRDLISDLFILKLFSVSNLKKKLDFFPKIAYNIIQSGERWRKVSA